MIKSRFSIHSEIKVLEYNNKLDFIKGETSW